MRSLRKALNISLSSPGPATNVLLLNLWDLLACAG